MPEKEVMNIAALITAAGTFILAMFGRSSLDKDIRTLQSAKVNTDRFEDFKIANEREHVEIKEWMEKIFDKLDDINKEKG